MEAIGFTVAFAGVLHCLKAKYIAMDGLDDDGLVRFLGRTMAARRLVGIIYLFAGIGLAIGGVAILGIA